MADHLSRMKAPRGSRKKGKKVGRGIGSGRGKRSGRGQKGYGARSGSKDLAGFEGGQMPLHRRLPKRGFKNLFRKRFTVINIRDLERWGLKEIGPEIMSEKNLVKKISRHGVKLLGEGEATRAYKVSVHKASGRAAEKIKKAGGEIRIIEG
jgi:large subunit ribosomal protein L15